MHGMWLGAQTHMALCRVPKLPATLPVQVILCLDSDAKKMLAALQKQVCCRRCGQTEYLNSRCPYS